MSEETIGDETEHHHHDHGHEGMDPVAHAALHLGEFREQKDAFLRDDPHSPLPHEARHTFSGLQYFPHNPDLTFVVPIDRDVPSDPLPMPTSTGEEGEMHRFGKVHLEVDGTPVDLTIFGDDPNDLFLPMRDATSGKETYGAGRYMEPFMVDEHSVLVDFNYLFNPFCAYNESYSCPLPPMENWLKVPIRGGEKTFPHSE
jgi:uncharacterized protein (DUF1684 family)